MSALMLLVLASTSAPDSVVVFPDRAQVTRSVAVPCGARVPVTFEHIPPAAAQDSFRATLKGAGSIDGLRAELVSREQEFSEKATSVRTQLEALAVQLETLGDQLSALQTQQRTNQRYNEIAAQLISRELADAPNPKTWTQALDGTLNSSFAAAKQSSELSSKLRALRLEQEELLRQQQELQLASARQSWTVEVLATCPGGKAELTLTYLVGGTGWTPEYEARANETDGTVELSTWATLHQATGEDWSQVELALSTAMPSLNATPPELKVLQLTAYDKGPEKKVLVRREEYVDRAQVSSGAAAPPAQGGLVAREQGLSVQLAVPEKARVPGDGAPVRLFVGKSKLKAKFELRAAPRALPAAFRVAELNNTGAWPLLPGSLDAFRSTGMVGRYQLERVPQGGAFTLTFGLEDTVRVKRTIVDELKRDVGLFNDKKRFTYAYTFEVANYGKQPVTVTLAEQLPVSELADINVTVGEKTTPGYVMDKEDGIAKWALPLKPGEKRRVELNFRVDVPNSYDTGGL